MNTTVISIDGTNHDAYVSGRYNVIVKTVCGLRLGPDDEVKWGSNPEAEGCIYCREVM